MRWTLPILLLACTADTKGVDSTGEPGPRPSSPVDPVRLADRDEDGVVGVRDCDDRDATVYPGAEEICDHQDNDCDGELNEHIYVDEDGDGWGRSVEGEDCEPGTNTAPATRQRDCDDQDPAFHPDQDEICDGLDNDCDGVTDERLYTDADGDGYGAQRGADESCDPALPSVDNDDDCDDSDATSSPDGEERCDGLDNDCDDDRDEGFYADEDGDGYGSGSPDCGAGGGYSTQKNDCDDDDPLTYKGAVERCDGKDNDCDSKEDEGYTDADADGYGVADVVCATGQLLSTVKSDCDDADATAYPGAPERCDGVDNDCDGYSDDLAAFEDEDGDGWGGARPGTDCATGAVTVAAGGDCDDSDPAVYPTADEVCDGVDNDCDGEGDEELAWTDADGDGYGETERAGDCDPTVTYAAVGDDCDDGDSFVHPYACDDCNGVDDDCDGEADEGDADGAHAVYLDEDGDGYGGEAGVTYGCADGRPLALEGGDCDDASAAVSPDMVEICQDGVDNDCDGLLDCEDDDCGDEDCSEADCADGVDGDQDGYLDCQDDDCWGVDCGYAVAVVTGGRLSGAVGSHRRRSPDKQSSTSDAAVSGSASGRVVVYSAAGAALASCDWRVGHMALVQHKQHRQGEARVPWGCETWTATTWTNSCAALTEPETDCGSHRTDTTVASTLSSLVRDSVSVGSGCGLDGDGFLPDALALDPGVGWQTVEGAAWYAGLWSTTASRSAASTAGWRTWESTQSQDVQLLLSEASCFMGPLDP